MHVIDDDRFVRESLWTLLGLAGYAVSIYDTAVAFLDEVATAPAGCVITDVRMPELSGLDLLRQLGEHRRRFPAIVLTGAADVAMAVEALKGGAVDFIEKPYDPDAILLAVEAALQRLQASDRASAVAAQVSMLSPREREVLQGVTEGLSNKLIARRLSISPRTIEAYRAKLMTKLGAHSVAALVQTALRAGAVAGPS